MPYYRPLLFLKLAIALTMTSSISSAGIPTQDNNHFIDSENVAINNNSDKINLRHRRGSRMLEETTKNNVAAKEVTDGRYHRGDLRIIDVNNDDDGAVDHGRNAMTIESQEGDVDIVVVEESKGGGIEIEIQDNCQCSEAECDDPSSGYYCVPLPDGRCQCVTYDAN